MQDNKSDYQAVIQTKNLCFSYGPKDKPSQNQIISGLNLKIAKGSITGLLGPNGAGKSTLLRLLAGISQPKQGSVLLNGNLLSGLKRKDIARLIAFVPQDVRMWLPFTSSEVVAMGRFSHQKGLGIFSSQNIPLVRECMEKTKIWHLADRPVTEISGGEAQRVRIAQALVQEAPILFLDEPTAHLDINFQVEVMDLLYKLNKEKNLTIIAALHDLNLAASYCHRLIILEHGQIIADGTSQEVLTKDILKKVFHVNVDIQQGPNNRPRLYLMPNIELNND